MQTKKLSVGNSIRVGTKATPVSIGSLINLSAQCPVEIKVHPYEVRCVFDVHQLINSVACRLDAQVESYISKIMAMVSAVIADALGEELPAAWLDFNLVIGDLLAVLRVSLDFFGPVISLVSTRTMA